MSRVLIVNADDYGRTPGVSAGILRAHLESIVTTTTAMVNLPGAVEAISRALASAPRLGLGVHLNLTFMGMRGMAQTVSLPPSPFRAFALVDDHCEGC